MAAWPTAGVVDTARTATNATRRAMRPRLDDALQTDGVGDGSRDRGHVRSVEIDDGDGVHLGGGDVEVVAAQVRAPERGAQGAGSTPGKSRADPARNQPWNDRGVVVVSPTGFPSTSTVTPANTTVSFPS